MTTTNFDLARMMKRHKNFHGCFMRDELPSTLHQGGYILNLDTSKGHIEAGHVVYGSHWVGIYVFPDRTLYWFDSYGFGPPQPLLDKWRSHFRELYSNTAILQKFGQCNCGSLSVQFLKHAEKGLPSVEKWIQSHQLISYTELTQ